jgi:geranylgeranyl transferase type-1 subunit beta
MDSIRLTLGSFIISSLDVLSSPSSTTPPTKSNGDESTSPPSLIPAADRSRLRAWVLSLRHRLGGFCGSPHHVLPEEFSSGYDGEKLLPTADDPENANIAATYFALVMLGVLADDSEDSARQTYKDVDRVATLRWLQKLQRPNGSFGELVKNDGTVGGGRDMRYCYMAATIRWILRGDDGDGTLDFNVDNFVEYIRRSQTFDGGIAESAMGESQAGYGYCAVAALSILDLAAEDAQNPNRYLQAGVPDIPALAHWLVMRQFAYLEEDEEDDEGAPAPTAQETPIPDMASLSVEDFTIAGFSGRPNKMADTCYVWWVVGALHMLGNALPGYISVDRPSARAFLLEKTQHVIGGFGKHADRPPDVYHSYLGLAALATMAGDEGEAGLGRFDVRLCIGQEAAARVAKGREYLKQTVVADEDDSE